jgi:SagB-type dehydrogenase family enzyme
MTFHRPGEDGGAPLERCICQRRSVRSFGARGLTTDELGQLLWAAQGITGPDGRRAVPSAGALYPLVLHAVIGQASAVTPGVYRYLPASHEMVLVAPGLQREKLGAATRGQDWIATAAAIMCIAAVFPRTTAKYGARGRGYVYVEAGHAAQNLMLQAVALGLGATMVGAFDDEAVTRLLHLGAEETPLCLLPLGTP